MRLRPKFEGLGESGRAATVGCRVAVARAPLDTLAQKSAYVTTRYVVSTPTPRREAALSRMPLAALPADSCAHEALAARAIALLTADAVDAAAVELALDAVIAGGADAASAFDLAFGPRHLMKALGRGQLSERAAEMADELLAACEGGGLAREVDFGSVHREEDESVDLSSPSPPPPPADADRVPLHMAAGCAL